METHCKVLLVVLALALAYLCTRSTKEGLSSCAIPAGTYKNVCKDCTSDCATLKCNCAAYDLKTKKVTNNKASLPLAHCQGRAIVANPNTGVLSC